MTDVFANDLVGDAGDGRSLDTRRREVGGELLEVLAVVENGVGRGVSDGAKIPQIFFDGLLHGSWPAQCLRIIVAFAGDAPAGFQKRNAKRSASWATEDENNP